MAMIYPSDQMAYSPAVKARAQRLDPICWRSYSGKTRDSKRAMELRRVASLLQAHRQLNRLPRRVGPWPVSRTPHPRSVLRYGVTLCDIALQPFDVEHRVAFMRIAQRIKQQPGESGYVHGRRTN